MAEKMNIPYWYAVHRDVTFTRQLLNGLSISNGVKRFKDNKLFDTRTLNIYEHIKNHNSNQLKEFYRLDDLLANLESSLFKEAKRVNTKLMLASTVYYFEDQLSKIIVDLENRNFRVINSYNGSIQVNPRLSNLDNCVRAVKGVNWFLGIVRPYYGTGTIKGANGDEVKNITFEEIKESIKADIPRWFFVHRNVTWWSLIHTYIEVNKSKPGNGTEQNILIDNPYIDNLMIQLYNYVIKDSEPNIALRNGNWVQEFYTIAEAQIYIQTQFSDTKFITKLLNG